MAGCKYWASSYIQLITEKKIYLTTSFDELNSQMLSKKDIINVKKAGLIRDSKIKVFKKAISNYGEYSTF